MGKRTRQPKRKKTTTRPESFLLALRKKLGIRTLGEVKEKALRDALIATKGDKALAAALLGIGKTTLYRSLAD
jgi:transcriptional regulator of acetoin/glycerol metabolism